MATVGDIVTAAGQLNPDDFVLLRTELDRLEERFWDSELAQASSEMDQAGLTDAEIDRLVLRRRREGRS